METPEGRPIASIVILTKNGSKTIRRCLESLFGQKTGYNYEVIAIDSGSTDGTLDILADYPVTVREIPPSEFNFGETKNLGFSISKGDFVIFLSQDAIPIGHDWLEKMIAPFEDMEVMVVQGIEKCGKDGFYWLREGLFWYTSEIRRWMDKYKHIGMSFVSIAIRRTAWEIVKFDRVPFGEDKLFQKKAVEAGFKIVYVKDTLVEHTHEYSLASLISRIRNEGLGARVSGETYSFRDLLADLTNFRIYRYLIKGLRSREIRNLGELLFPLIRPVYIYMGMHSSE